MVSNLSDLGVELFCRLAQVYRAFTWKDVHPLALRPGAERTLFGLAAKRWLPTPGKAFIATLADVVEERGDPAFLRNAAAALQRVATADPKFRRDFLELATHVNELVWFKPGRRRVRGLCSRKSWKRRTAIPCGSKAGWTRFSGVALEG